MLLAVLKRQRQALCGLVEQLSSSGAGGCNWIPQLGSIPGNTQQIPLSSSAAESRSQPAKLHDAAAGSAPDEQQLSRPQHGSGRHDAGGSMGIEGSRSLGSDYSSSSSSSSQSRVQQDGRNRRQWDSRATGDAVQPPRQPGSYWSHSTTKHQGRQETSAAAFDEAGYTGERSRERSKGHNDGISRLQPEHQSDRHASSSGRLASSTPLAADADTFEPFGALQAKPRRREHAQASGGGHSASKPRKPREPQHRRSASPDAALLTVWLKRVPTLDALEQLVNSNFSRLNTIHVSTAALALQRIVRSLSDAAVNVADSSSSSSSSSVGIEQKDDTPEHSDVSVSQPSADAAAGADAAMQRAHAIMQKLATKMLQDPQEATPRTLSNVVQACAQLKYSQPTLVNAIAGEAQRRAHDFEPMDMNGTIKGLTALGALDPELAQTLLQQVLADAASYQPRALFFAIRNLTDRGASSAEVLPVIQARLLPSLDALTVEQCVKLLEVTESQRWGAVPLQAARAALFSTLQPRLGDLSPHSAAQLTMAVPPGALTDEWLINGVLQSIIHGAASLTPAQLASAAVAMYKHGIYSQALQQQLHTLVVPVMGTLKPVILFNLAQLCAGPKLHDRQLLNALIPCAVASISHHCGYEVAHLLYACAKLHVFDEQVISTMAQACTSDTKQWLSFPRRVLSNTVWAFGQARYPVPELFHGAADLFISKPSNFDKRFALSLGRGFAMAGMAHEALFCVLESCGSAWLGEHPEVSWEVASLLKSFAIAKRVDSDFFPAVAAHAAASLDGGFYALLNEGPAETAGSTSSTAPDAYEAWKTRVTLVNLAWALSQWPASDPQLLVRLAAAALSITGGQQLTLEQLDTLQSCLEARGLLGAQSAEMVVQLEQARSAAKERESLGSVVS